ncbi:hypothetical protein F0562_018988 [Nyssa sinensis]|uniref:DUF4220 domain-containing protein n=1 Tax=Nyssa sinensis TaxID=561372 RepID=A0A5J4ZDN5_9ASTE|nr:hypothetical protein F0562_018988 [Nyssa sinensis]
MNKLRQQLEAMQKDREELEAAAAQKLASSGEAARVETEKAMMDEVNKLGGEFMDHKYHLFRWKIQKLYLDLDLSKVHEVEVEDLESTSLRPEPSEPTIDAEPISMAPPVNIGEFGVPNIDVSEPGDPMVKEKEPGRYGVRYVHKPSEAPDGHMGSPGCNSRKPLASDHSNFFCSLKKASVKGLDAAAKFGIGLISKTQRDTSRSGHVDNGDLLAFWAPFLLVHLGGPDTITAFALEDNELWLRHLLELIVQCSLTVYVFIITFYRNKLWIPTLFMLFAGIIKYLERTRALYRGSTKSFRNSMLKKPDPGPNYAKLMDEYYSMKEAQLPTRIEMIREPNQNTKSTNVVKGVLSDLQVVKHAFEFFETFKGLIVDLIFSFRERKQSRDFFLEQTARNAFRVVEVELNFIYEVLYTKIVVVRGTVGYLLRFASFGLVVATLVLFYCQDQKQFLKVDVQITYTLLGVAIALDVIPFVRFIFSDWTAVTLKKSSILGKVLFV